MSIADTVARGRAVAEQLMTATCIIQRPGEPQWNEATLQNDVSMITVYAGKCRIRPTGSQDHGEDAADQTFIESQFVMSVPVLGTGNIRAGDVVTLGTSVEDPALSGRKYSVISMPAYSQGTARRIPVRETQ